MRSITEFPSFQDAVSAEVALWVPPGLHTVQYPVSCRGKSLSLVGAGDSSRLVFTGGGDFLTFDGGEVGRYGHTLSVRGVLIQALNNCGAAIKATFSGDRDTPQRCVSLQDVTITGHNICGRDLVTYNFSRGVWLVNAGNVVMRGVHADACLAPGSVGVQIESDGVTHATEVFVHNCILDKFDTGLVFGGTQEGLYFSDSTILSCVTGIAVASAYEGKPGIFVRGSHINTRMCGLNTESAAQIIVTDNLFYSQFGNGVQPYMGVRIGAGNAPYALDAIVRGNIFQKVDALAPESYGIMVAGGATVENVLIDGNKIRGYNFGGLLQPGSSGVYWTKTNEVAGATYPVYNQGSGNTVES